MPTPLATSPINEKKINPSTILKHIASQEDFTWGRCTALSGGDINATYLLENPQRKVVLKLNDVRQYPHMFAQEAKGLQLIANTKSFDTPEVLGYGNYNDTAYLMLNYIENNTKHQDFWEDFGRKLAKMHHCTAVNFGGNEDNYIGSLPQYNKFEGLDAAQFYLEKRLHPQFRLAEKKGYVFEKKEALYQKLPVLIPEEKPSLIHGDLWNGNYLTGPNGKAYLIDPAVCFAPREMDLAMMKLFGGFPSLVFETYAQHFPLAAAWKNRISLWQLYYLLVHLNLFGQSYYQPVKRIVEKFS